MEKESKLDVFLGSSLIFAIAQALNLYTISRAKAFFEANQIVPPEVSAAPALGYFLGMAVVVGLILYFLPTSVLRIILKVLFAFMYSWGALVVLGLSLPPAVAIIIALTGGIIWLVRPKIWLHNLLLALALVSAGSAFGPIFSPWTVVIVLSIVSVYDVLAVRFGYMLWLVRELSRFDTLPAFIIPKRLPLWNLNLKEASLKRLMEEESAQREFSILGGGDIGLPLILSASVFYTYGLIPSMIVAAFSLFGLIFAYWIQIFLLKGRPLPALPPISFVSFIGFLLALLVT